jgi:S-adenosylmethionine:tRNA ribosyltransferase-isomerase
MPLPPYIRRDKEADERDAADRERYQTVYARAPGAVAAPTAGLHFTPEVLAKLDGRGIERAFVTLHVGLGTFKPVTADELSEHVMHREAYTIPPETFEALNRAKRDQRRIVAVGTTTARVLESQPPGPAFEPKTAETGIFIYPPYDWKHVGALLTNFHLPRSTLIALVAGMVGLDEQRRIYRTAIEQRYRFFSYGDAMLVTPEARA